ncbi:class I SAM-dependent rRNA methyltransferase [Zooshikella marina]|uniref:class I SAM-dependent rRNA methyltransferase n=1 Tax=Zooshikella ganghwensis TaxID=202772 RepID=UPI00040572D9|nr:class I SAM-dependent rRNA methyltransferase [Zooshikella ganghwensis]MBU2706311.1 class I SAM-dependent rRNA methyltransferase [Zooshikella ganghwensis]
MSLGLVRLKAKADRRLRAGHIWIFSNEVDTKITPLGQFQPGEQVVVENAAGKPLGIAYINPNTLICGRLISRDVQYKLDKSLLVHRLNVAMSLRDRMFDKPYYRLAFGDSDNLPGLVIDRFDDVAVVQIATAGMEAIKEDIIAALQQVINPKGILFKNDSQVRQIEGLDEYTEIGAGDVPNQVKLIENNAYFMAPVIDGQKTGWFYDHRMNRQRLLNYVKDKRVLDVFSYVGGWGIQSAVAGASETLCIDASEHALHFVRENAALNNVNTRVNTIKADAFNALRDLRDEEEKFDVIIIDPPAFIKRRKDQAAGEQAYRRINELAMRLLTRDGILVSASCSMHLKRETLLDTLRQSSRHLDRHLQILEQGHQGPDHPILPAIPETDYLKAFIARIVY